MSEKQKYSDASTALALAVIFLAWLVVALLDGSSVEIPLHYALAVVWFCAGVALIHSAWRE